MATINDHTYIHGAGSGERERLATLNRLLNGRSLRALRLSPGQRVLDVGCGLAQLTAAMAEVVGEDGLVVGVDSDQEQLRQAAEVVGLQTGVVGQEAGAVDAEVLDLRHSDGGSLPLRQQEWGTFDVVHARFLLEHVLEPERVVAEMLRAVRPGGRIVLEDDDHDLLRLWPEVPEFERLWEAFLEAWDELGSDPLVGRRLVSLVEDAGGRVIGNDWLFFGGCAAQPDFPALSRNFSAVVAGAKERILDVTEVSVEDLAAGLQAFDSWSRRAHATLWYATCWVEGERPESAPRPRRRKRRKDEPEEPFDDVVERFADSTQQLGIPQHTVETTGESFQSLGLSPKVVEALRKIGFQHPTAIQAGVIPRALEGRDVIGLAQTGSGKTAAFCLPLAEKVGTDGGLRGLILCPTREIAMQTSHFLETFGRLHGIRSAEVIGGVRIEPQISRLRSRPDVVVATPGRLLDHMRRGTVDVGDVSSLVLDEADHMLDLGFLPQIRDILRSLPNDRQTLMFSATMPSAIERLAQQFMRDPVRIDLLPDSGAAEGIDHRLYLVEDDNKKRCLLSLVAEEEGSVLVFLRRKVDADWACRQLQIEGHPVERIHSGLTQSQRAAALQGFREGEHRVLVATDVAARGLDIPRIQHIINFDPPQAVEDYIHRAGRTARGSLQGTVSTIATWDAKPFLRLVEAALGSPLRRCVAPGVEPYIEAQARKPRRRRFR